jgi:hypothetical protein
MKIAGIVIAALSIPGLIGGMGWIVLYFLSQGSLPINGIGSANLLIGGALVLGEVLFLVGGIVIAAVARKPVASF